MWGTENISNDLTDHNSELKSFISTSLGIAAFNATLYKVMQPFIDVTEINDKLDCH